MERPLHQIIEERMKLNYNWLSKSEELYIYLKFGIKNRTDKEKEYIMIYENAGYITDQYTRDACNKLLKESQT